MLFDTKTELPYFFLKVSRQEFLVFTITLRQDCHERNARARFEDKLQIENNFFATKYGVFREII